MSGQAVRRRDYRVAYTRKFQIFGHEFNLVAEDADMGRCLDYLVQGAEQDFAAHVPVDIRVETDNDGHKAFIDGELLIAHVRPSEILFAVYRKVHVMATAPFKEDVVLHAASALRKGRRVLVLGPSGAGKTTFMLQALLDGWQVEGDEQVYLNGGSVVALPRCFHVKESGLEAFPQLAEQIRGLPDVGADGGRIYALDPAEFGYKWRIGRGAADVVLFLEPERGKEPELVPCPKYRMVNLMMSQCYPPSSRGPGWIGEVSALANAAACYRLVAGPPRQTVLAVDAVLG
jgi:hypothetical protein